MRMCFLFVCGLLAPGLFAQADGFVAQGPAVVPPDQPFAVTVTLDDLRAEGDVLPPDFAPLRLVGGPQTSTSVQIINGNMSRSTTYTYYLSADAEGTFVILPFGVETSEGWLETAPLRVSVEAGAPAAPRARERSPFPGFEELLPPSAAPAPRRAPRSRRRKTYRI